ERDGLVDAEELLAFGGAEDPRETGMDRIHVYDVSDIEDRVLVRHHAVRLDGEALVIDAQEARARIADVHPHGCGARTAVERDDERAAGAVADVGSLVVDVEHRRDRLAILVPDGLCPRRHPVRYP